VIIANDTTISVKPFGKIGKTHLWYFNYIAFHIKMLTHHLQVGSITALI